MISLFVVPNPTKIKECYDEIQNQMSQWGKADYYTDEQLADAKGHIIARNHSRELENHRRCQQVSFQWCSTSLDYYTDLNQQLPEGYPCRYCQSI
jgi:zinc protease